MFWRRYRSTVAGALLLAAATGSFLGFALYAGGNSDYREQAGVGGLLYWLALGAILGATTALASLIGGAVALLIHDRGLTLPARSRIIAGSIGAGLGGATLWLSVGIVNASVTPTAASFFGVALLIALVSAVAASILAGLLLSRAERRSVGDRAKASKGRGGL